MAKKDKVAAPVKVAAKKEAYQPTFNVPAGNPDRHIVRIANRTWLMIQPGSSTFLGQYATKDQAMVAAKRHVAVTKGVVVCHA